MQPLDHSLSRRRFLASAASGTAALAIGGQTAKAKAPPTGKAQIAITLDLEMSRMYPTRDQMHWDYEKGNLNAETKKYSLEAARRVKQRGGRIHFFSVARVCEQENVDWLKELSAEGHPIGNHTYDHVYVLAKTLDAVQFRFRRAPWLIEGKTTYDVIRDNIALASRALKQRAGIDVAGFRTPGGFSTGLEGRADIQRMMLELGFDWVSCKYPSHKNTKPGVAPSEEIFDSIVAAQAAAQPFVYPSGLIDIPMSPISDVGGFRTGRWKIDAFLEAIRRSVAWAIENGAVYDFLCHPSCMYVSDPKFQTIDMICDMVEKAGDRAELVDLDAIAKRFRQ